MPSCSMSYIKGLCGKSKGSAASGVIRLRKLWRASRKVNNTTCWAELFRKVGVRHQGCGISERPCNLTLWEAYGGIGCQGKLGASEALWVRRPRGLPNSPHTLQTPKSPTASPHSVACSSRPLPASLSLSLSLFPSLLLSLSLSLSLPLSLSLSLSLFLSVRL